MLLDAEVLEIPHTEIEKSSSPIRTNYGGLQKLPLLHLTILQFYDAQVSVSPYSILQYSVTLRWGKWGGGVVGHSHYPTLRAGTGGK